MNGKQPVQQEDINQPFSELIICIRWTLAHNAVSSLFRRAFTNQSLTIPRYDEHFGRFPSNSLYRGFRYSETSI